MEALVIIGKTVDFKQKTGVDFFPNLNLSSSNSLHACCPLFIDSDHLSTTSVSLPGREKIDASKQKLENHLAYEFYGHVLYYSVNKDQDKEQRRALFIISSGWIWQGIICFQSRMLLYSKILELGPIASSSIILTA